MKRLLRNVLAWTVFVLAILLKAGEAQAEKRVALVIGNGEYKESLKTAVRDASELARALSDLRFTSVANPTNVNRKDMRQAIEEFALQAENSEVTLFYFAGHGVQVNGRNYLIPVGAKIAKVEDVPHEAIALEEVFDAYWNSSARIKLMILDACRDNPFADPADPTGWVEGLAEPLTPPTGLVTVFAAKPGETAQDGRFKHSPFTASLLYYITEPGLALHDLLIAVRDDVEKFTSGGQVPWANGIPSRTFYFQDPAWIEGTILSGDDEVLVLVNGEERISWNSDGNRSVPHKINLKAGRNEVVIKVFNQSTFVGGCSWLRQGYEDLRRSIESWGIRLPGNLVQPPEGWNFGVRFRRGPDDTLPLILQGEEKVPEPTRHGKMFSVSRATISVHRVTGMISFEGVEPRLW